MTAPPNVIRKIRDCIRLLEAHPNASSGKNNQSNNLRDAAGQAYSKASEMARDASDKVKQAASDTASTVTENVKVPRGSLI